MSIQMVLVGFVLHMVDGLYVVMLHAQILLKQEDGASNMATRSQVALWMDAVISVLRMVFAKDTEATVYAMSSIVRSCIQVQYVLITLFFNYQVQHSDE